jgi:hypothetical protein
VKLEELKQRLIAEGCNPSRYAVGAQGAASDAFCLVEGYGRWTVFYTERGENSPPIFDSTSEDEACEFFFRYMAGLRHEHCVGFLRSEERARFLRSKLQAQGIDSRQDRIPFGGPQDFRFRLFVEGKAVHKAREVLGELPIKDCADT